MVHRAHFNKQAQPLAFSPPREGCCEESACRARRLPACGRFHALVAIGQREPSGKVNGGNARDADQKAV